MMTYLIIHNNQVFYTNWFSAENNWAEGMMVVNLLNHTYTVNGTLWMEIESDHL